MKFKITDNYGIVVLRDKNQNLPTDSTNENRKALNNSAKQGDIFYIDREDPIVNLQIELVSKKDSVKNLLNWYEPVGGSFLFNNTSGEIVLTGLEDWVNKKKAEEILKLEPGFYSVEVFSQEVDCLENYSIEMSKQTGKEDWEYYNKALSPSLAFAGCLPTLIAIPVMIFATLKIGLYFLLAAAILWLPFIVRTQSKRYKKISKMIEQYDKELPLFILLLTKIDSDRGLVGGFVK